MHQFTENINRGKKKRKKTGKISASLTCSLLVEITWLKVKKEELFKQKHLWFLHALFQLPGARALQSTVSLERDLFVYLILELEKCFLVTPNWLKNIAGGRQHVSPDKQQVLNGECITKHFLFCQGRHKGQKIGINLCFLRQQIGI